MIQTGLLGWAELLTDKSRKFEQNSRVSRGNIMKLEGIVRGLDKPAPVEMEGQLMVWRKTGQTSGFS